MNDKILLRVVEALRATPLRMHEQILLSLQLLAWVRMSKSAAVAGLGLGVDEILSSSTVSPVESLQRLEGLESPLGDAFAGAGTAGAAAGHALLPALKLAKSIEDDGLLATYMPNDVALQDQALSEWFTISPKLADLLVAVANVSTSDTAYVAWDSSGQIAGRLQAETAEVFAENPYRTPLPALVQILAGGVPTTVTGDPIRHPRAVEAGALRKFDVAIAIPPIGMRLGYDPVASDLFNRFWLPRTDVTGTALQHLFAQSRRRAIVVVPPSFLFGPGSDQALRAALVERGVVEAVVALPEGLLSGTRLPLAMLVLAPNGERESIRFVDASSDPYFDGTPDQVRARLDHLVRIIEGAESDESVTEVSGDAVLENDAQLQVSRYVLSSEQKRLKDAIAAHPLVRLGDLVETVRPLAFKPERFEGSIEVREVAAANLPPYGGIQIPGRILWVDAVQTEKSGKQFLRTFDIVLMIKGSTGKAGLVLNAPAAGEGGWIAGQSATILRSKPGIDPKALFVLLRSELGQALLKSITSGTVISMISLRELMGLQIPMPTAQEVDVAARAFDRECELQESIYALMEQQAAATANLWALPAAGCA